MYFYSILCACNTITVVYYSSIAHGAMVDGKFSINRGAVGNEIIVMAKSWMKYLLDRALAEITRPARLCETLREKSWYGRDAAGIRFSTCAGEALGVLLLLYLLISLFFFTRSVIRYILGTQTIV